MPAQTKITYPLSRPILKGAKGSADNYSSSLYPKAIFDKGKTLKEIERSSRHNYRTIKKHIEIDSLNSIKTTLQDIINPLLKNTSYSDYA